MLIKWNDTHSTSSMPEKKIFKANKEVINVAALKQLIIGRAETNCGESCKNAIRYEPFSSCGFRAILHRRIKRSTTAPTAAVTAIAGTDVAFSIAIAPFCAIFDFQRVY